MKLVSRPINTLITMSVKEIIEFAHDYVSKRNGGKEVTVGQMLGLFHNLAPDDDVRVPLGCAVIFHCKNPNGGIAANIPAEQVDLIIEKILSDMPP